MAYDVQLKQDPTPMPLKSAILILMHRKRRQAFVCYTSNARGRAAVLASSIRHRDELERAHVRDLPPGDVTDFALLATRVGLEPKLADDAVERMKKKLERDGFKIFGGSRSAVPMVSLNGRRMTLAAAMAEAKTAAHYQTVYRRLERGWPLKQALDLEERA
jgi:hypothetical protein